MNKLNNWEVIEYYKVYLSWLQLGKPKDFKLSILSGRINLYHKPITQSKVKRI